MAASTLLRVTSEHGQMGNRLRLYAQVLAVAFEYGYSVANPGFEPYAPYFKVSHVVDGEIVGGSAPASWPTEVDSVGGARLATVDVPWSDGPAFDLGSEARGFHRFSIVNIDGFHYRTGGLVKQHAARIREAIRPLSRHRAVVRRIVGTRRSGHRVVGIHMRRTDYRSFLDGRFFFPVEEYQSVIDQVVTLTKGRVDFVLVGDELDSISALKANHIFRSNGDSVMDLWMLAGCDAILGPPSSFSHWASFSGEVPRYRMTSANQAVSTSDFEVADDYP